LAASEKVHLGAHSMQMSHTRVRQNQRRTKRREVNNTHTRAIKTGGPFDLGDENSPTMGELINATTTKKLTYHVFKNPTGSDRGCCEVICCVDGCCALSRDRVLFKTPGRTTAELFSGAIICTAINEKTGKFQEAAVLARAKRDGILVAK
jgi:hypothetical protein